MAAAVVVLVVDHQRLSWAAGAVFGALAGTWVVMRDSPPGYVENWRVGYEGERKTEKALAPLERSGWRVLHDIDGDRGNFDHVAVGQGGVFLLETKYPVGIVELRAGVPYVRRRLIARKDSLGMIRRQALGAAARLHREIEQRVGQPGWVCAVVVFWSEFPEGHAEHEKCVFIHGSQLRSWLEARPVTLSPGQVAMIAASVAQLAE